VTNGYNLGMVDVFVNGVKFVNGTDFTATDGTTVALAAGLAAGNIVEIDNLLTAYLPTNALRTITTFTATAAQTTFSVSYTQGLIDVFYNGSNLAQSEYTATNGTSIILATACQLNDIVVVYAYSYSVGAYSGIGGSGTATQVAYFTSSAVISSSSNLYWDNTNTRLGIGTSSPLEQLNLMGANAYTSKIRFTNGASNTGYYTNFGYNSDGNKAYLQIADGGAASTIMTWNYNGNVIIGNSTDLGAKLQVYNGRVLLNNGYSYQFYNTSSVAVDTLQMFTDGNVYLDAKDSTGGNLIFRTSNSNTERMRITSGGNVGVGISGVYSDVRLMTRGVDATASNYAFRAETSAAGNIMYLRNDGLIVSGTLANSPTNYTTGSAANMYVSGGGELQRSTSSLKYKTDVKDYDKGLTEVLQMRPVYYKGKNDGDIQFAGLIAEEIHELGLTEFVQYAEDGTPDALAYSNMIALLTKAIQEMNTKIIELEKIVATK
jgi:hypothetical protein